MCIFSGTVDLVAGTQIFARALPSGEQLLAYQMDFAAADDVAMILPLPVPAGVGDDALTFIDLSDYPSFFHDLQRAFPAPLARGGFAPQSLASALPVHEVGDFVASFVPRPEDFVRLDPRFRLPPSLLESFAWYGDWGFAVFELASKASRPGLLERLRGRREVSRQSVHPMAFRFPRRDPREVFFPTVHVHDGTVPDQAEFDHALFVQGAAPQEEWRSVDSLAIVRAENHGMVDRDASCQHRMIVGRAENCDVVLPAV